MRIPAARPALLLLLLLCAAPARSQAAGFDAFLGDLRAAGLPTGAISAGIGTLRGVDFVDEADMGPAAAMFLPDAGRIRLSRRLRDPATGGLKRASELGPVDCAVVIHELWHAYYWNSLRSGGSQAAELFLRGWRTRYDAYHFWDREEIQDEGYALFIQEVSRAYLQARWLLEKAPPEQRRRLKEDPRFASAYERGIADNVYGYYRGLSGQPVNSAVPISPEDKASILAFFFDGKISGKFARDFADERP